MSKGSVSLGRDFARAIDPVMFAQDCGIDPDPVQVGILNPNSKRLLLLCSRQMGKSTRVPSVREFLRNSWPKNFKL